MALITTLAGFPVAKALPFERLIILPKQFQIPT
jgi:hypothetical protein